MSQTIRVAALVLLLVICLLTTIPARILGLVLPAGQVSLQGFSGTLWQGKASRCLVSTPAGYLHLGAISWQLEPLSLLLFAPRLTLDSNWGSQTVAATVVVRGSEDVDLSELEANIPADLLRQFVPINLAGVFSVQINQLSMRAGVPVKGAGRLLWQGGGWNAPAGPVPLGSYALDFSQEQGAPLIGDVVTLAGAVSAEGSVRLQGRAYGVDIMVSSKAGLDQRLQQALSLVARPLDEGFHIELDGEF